MLDQQAELMCGGMFIKNPYVLFLLKCNTVRQYKLVFVQTIWEKKNDANQGEISKQKSVLVQELYKGRIKLIIFFLIRSRKVSNVTGRLKKRKGLVTLRKKEAHPFSQAGQMEGWVAGGLSWTTHVNPLPQILVGSPS